MHGKTKQLLVFFTCPLGTPRQSFFTATFFLLNLDWYTYQKNSKGVLFQLTDEEDNMQLTAIWRARGFSITKAVWCVGNVEVEIKILFKGWCTPEIWHLRSDPENPRCQKYEDGSDLHISAVHEPFGISIGSSL